MKVLLATQKPFAAKAVNGIREILEAAGHADADPVHLIGGSILVTILGQIDTGSESGCKALLCESECIGTGRFGWIVKRTDASDCVTDAVIECSDAGAAHIQLC